MFDPSDYNVLLCGGGTRIAAMLGAAHGIQTSGLPVTSWAGVSAGSMVATLIATGHSAERSYELLAQAGVPSAMHPLALYGAAALDLVLGVATLAFRHRAVWLAQAAVIVGYTAILTLRMPEFWLHPFGPLVKNLPMLAVIGWLCMLERR